MSNEQWQNATAESPCEICGKHGWCSRSDDGSAINCRHSDGYSDQYGQGKSHVGSDGKEYWTFRIIPKCEASDSFVPTLSPSPSKADPDTLHKVYASSVRRFHWTNAAAQELSRRGLSTIEVLKLQQAGYSWLPGKGRSSIARGALKDCGEGAVSQTPGFVVREFDGKRYWTLSGREGLAIPVRDTQGRIVALMVRSVTSDGGSKYRYLTSKKAGGAGPGSPIHTPLSNLNREEVRLTEGVLKADVSTAKSGMLTIGLPGVGSWRRAAAVLAELGAKTVHVAFDADWRTNANVGDALRNVVEHLASHGFNVVLEVWEPEDGKGIDDVLIAGKPVQRIEDEAEIRQLLADAEANLSESSKSQARADHRSPIEITPDEYIVVDQTLTAMAEDPHLYKRNGQLVHVVQEPNDSEELGIHRSAGTPRILAMSSGHLRERMTQRCFFFKSHEEGETQCSPPVSIVNSIFTRGFWPHLRNLSGVTEIPVLRPDGTILSEPGWDKATGLLYMPDGERPELIENPTRADAISAKDLLLDVVTDFPFSTPAHQSSWLAGLLTILARRAFSGPAPMFLIDANIRGSGKSMLTDIISIIATSRDMPRFGNSESEEESRKRITALALAGDPLVLIDNINGTLGSASLDAVLTSTSWKDRRLGSNEIVEMPMQAIWFATGNNVILAGDMSRRVCHVRLDSLEENPEERSDFRHPKLITYVRENRLQLLSAGLTILRAFIVAGRPPANLKPWGSFDGWSELIRDCLSWVEMADPGETRKELAQASDRDAAALRMLFDGWPDIDPKGEGLSAADMVQLLDFHKRRRDYVDSGMPFSAVDLKIEEERQQTEAVKTALCELCGVSDLTSKEVRKIGNQLRRFKGRVIGESRLECNTHGRNKVNRWRVSSIDAVCAASAVSVFPRQKKLSINQSDNSNEINNKERGTHTAHPAHTALETMDSNCPMCGFDSDRPGEECSTCRN